MTTANTGESSNSPSNSHPSSHQVCTLEVRFDNWKWRKAAIVNPHEGNGLYRIECHLRSPQITIHSLDDTSLPNTPIGDATFHTLSSRIDIRLHEHQIILSSSGLWKDAYTYTSPTLRGMKMTWQSRSKGRDFNLVCLDDKAIAVAQISIGSWSITKAGTIELVGERVTRKGPLMDEIILTGLAMMQQRMVRQAAV
jgi:hypothetical protein